MHYVVESALRVRHGFLGQVAAGADAGFVMQAVHDRAKRDVDTEAVQVEAIVEALQTQLWGGTFDQAAFAEGARLASEARGQPAFDLGGIDPHTALYQPVLALLERWQQVPFHQALELRFPIQGV